ncbi:MAG: nuclear transport factor 2 family protein [Anaerolineales bacterium]|nr:MAG: nuclear transport factor 2 family protein [Anaerolineales bacterium]
MKDKLKELASQFFKGVHEGNPSIVEELVAEDSIATYPVFMRLFNLPALRGRKAYMDHAINFSSTWKNSKVTIHEIVAEGQKVSL